MNVFSLRWSKKVCLVLFFATFSSFIEDSYALFGDPSGTIAGRPRFKKGDKKLFYFGIGIGMNPYDHIDCQSCIGFGGAINEGIQGTINGFPSSVKFTGFPVLFFGFVPSYARFMRHHFEVNIKFASLSVNTTNTRPMVIAGDTDKYVNVDFSTINFRAMYELLFQTKPIFDKLILFAGGGLGFSVNNASLSASPLDSSSSGGTDAATAGSSIELKKVTNFSITFAASAGFVFDVSQTFALELKTRYFFIMTPFGQSGSFGLYRDGFEIIASILLKF